MTIDDLHIGDVLLYKSNKGFIPWIIKLVTNKPYFHSALYSGEGKILDVVPFNIREHEIKTLKDIDVYRPVCEDTREVAVLQSTIAFASSVIKRRKMRYRYGWANLIGFLFIGFVNRFKIRAFENDAFLICSEFVTDTLTLAGFRKKLCDHLNSWHAPGDIPECFDVKRVEE